jgi:MoaA/NifB/PqqE/SkfB family radical SAM enzyme
VLKVGHLRLDDFRSLLDRNPWLLHVELSNYGELFLNPDLAQILACACERGVQLTADNGANLNDVREDVLEALVKYRFRRITCSIDGASAESYARYRVGGDFETVIRNVRTIIRHKQRHGSAFPRLTWQFVVFPHNRHEVEDARALARELGMGFSAKLPWVDAPELLQIQPGPPPESREAYRRRYGVNYMRHICHQLWRMPQVNWDGRILGCCRNFWGEFGGNAFTGGLEDALNSERMDHARGMLMGLEPPRPDIPCATCELYFDMRDSSQWLMPPEVHLPASVLHWLARRGLRKRFIVGAAGSTSRVVDAVYSTVAGLRRRWRSAA